MWVYIWTDQWLPWENTVAYYPLTSSTTVNDISGNNRNLTNNWSVVFWTYKWVNCAYTNWTNQYLSQSFSFSGSACSISIWVYFIKWTAPNYDPIYYWNLWIWINWTGNIINVSPWLPSSIALTSDSRWDNFIITYDGAWNLKFYRNWELIISGTWKSPTIWSNLRIWTNVSTGTDYWKGWLSEVIIENRAWTAEQVAWYYNQTKSQYWIS